MLAVFTSPEGASGLSDFAPFLVSFTGAELLQRLPASTAIVVNLRSNLGFEIPPEGLAAFRQELAS